MCIGVFQRTSLSAPHDPTGAPPTNPFTDACPADSGEGQIIAPAAPVHFSPQATQ